MVFTDRGDAGRRLAHRLRPYADRDLVVLGLPRGGVPVAFEVASALHAPLDLIIVRKLGVPFQPELAMGAVGEDGATVLDNDIIQAASINSQELAEVERRERAEVERRACSLRGSRAPVALAGKTALIVDDGIATGSTARAACEVARVRGAKRVILATPVGPRGVERRLRPAADEVVCLSQPVGFYAVGQAYLDFRPTSDEEVVQLMERTGGATEEPAAAPSTQTDPPASDREVSIPLESIRLGGRLTVPEQAEALVVFAHGSGSSRHSPRNRRIAAALGAAGLGTLLFDLLTREEEVQRRNVFDVELLGRRLLGVTAWLQTRPDVPARIGYFGASTGAAAALYAAAEPGAVVGAIVSRGGRPDLAGSRLSLVRAPTLLIVGGRDVPVIELNRAAQSRLRCLSRLEVVPGATHLFEEAGALDTVARLAIRWFTAHLLAG